MHTIGAAKFKAQCLALLDHLDPDGVVITKHGRAVARLVPYEQESGRLIGALKGKIAVRGDVTSTGLSWDASSKRGP